MRTKVVACIFAVLIWGGIAVVEIWTLDRIIETPLPWSLVPGFFLIISSLTLGLAFAVAKTLEWLTK